MLSCRSSALAVYDLLLTKTRVDAVFHGETEVSLPMFLEKFERGESCNDTPGIPYLDKAQAVGI